MTDDQTADQHASACLLPCELSFRAIGRWLAVGKEPSQPDFEDQANYGSRPGEQRGLSAFLPPDAPRQRKVAVRNVPALERLSDSPSLIGSRLFRNDLLELLTEQLVENGRAVLHSYANQSMVGIDAIAAAIAEQSKPQPLVLDATNPVIFERFEDDCIRLHASLAFTGDLELWWATTGRRASARLRAAVGDDCVTLAVVVSPDDVARAVQVLEFGVREVRRGIEAQKDTLVRFTGNLTDNARALAEALIQQRDQGRLTSRISVRVEQ